MDSAAVRTFVLTLVGLLPLVTSQKILECNFEAGIKGSETLPCQCSGVECLLEQQTDPGNFNWLVFTGETPSSDTGPSGDHTLNDGTGKYIYAEASDINPNTRAEIRSPTLTITATSCLTFWYHMKGQHMGELQVLLKIAGGQFAVSWSRQAEQGDDWIEGKVVLGTSVDMVAFKTIRGGNHVGMPFGDIALDDIKIEPGVCPGITTKVPTTQAPTTTAATTQTPPNNTPTPPTTASTTTTTQSPSTGSMSTANTTKQVTATTLPVTSPKPTTKTSQTTNVQSEATSATTPPTSGSTTTTSAPSTVHLGDLLTTDSGSRHTTESTESESGTTKRTTELTDSGTINRSTESSDSGTTVRTTGRTIESSSTSARSPTVSESDTTEITPGQSQHNLWGLDETLWIIILVVAGAVILVLLVIVCVQACAMRRMRTARIVRQSDDYSNIEAYNRDPKMPQKDDPPQGYINAYDNMAMEHDDKTHTNGGML